MTSLAKKALVKVSEGEPGMPQHPSLDTDLWVRGAEAVAEGTEKRIARKALRRGIAAVKTLKNLGQM